MPLLEVGKNVLFESAVINEYIDETTPLPRLHPEDPLRRAQNRGWIEIGSALLVDGYNLQSATDEASAREASAAVRAKLGMLEREVVLPFFNGAELSLVDAALAPALQRLLCCEEIEPSLALFEGLPKIRSWRDGLLDRDSVKKSTIPTIRQLYREYLAGAGSPSRQAEPPWLGRRAA